MKKFAIGCFAVLVVLAVAGGGIAWFKVIKPGMDMAGGFMELGEEFERLDNAVENRAEYRPPADGRLDPATFERFLAAQRQIRGALEGRLGELKEKYDALDQRLDQDGDSAGLGEVFGAYADIGDLLIEGKRAQVAALNAHDFSLAEYAWVRGQVYRALGESVAVASFIDQGNRPEFSGEVPAEIRELITPHRDELLEALAIAWWGF